MSTQWMDDFSSYGTGSTSAANMLNGLYAECNFVCATDPDPHGSGLPVLQCGVSSFYDGKVQRKTLTSNQTTVGIATRWWLNSLPSATNQWPKFAEFRSQENNNHIYISCDPSGYLYAARVDNGGDVTVATSSSPVVIANAWYHYEVKVVFDATNGSIEVRQEGVRKLYVTGIRTTSNVSGTTASCGNVVIANSGGSGAGPLFYIKDYIVWDGTGAQDNDFFGSCQVYKLLPSGDVSLGWTPSTGTTGYNLINETTPDDDTTYISAASALSSTFNLTDTPVDTTSVKSVMVVHRSRKLDGGDGNVKVSLVGSGTENGTDRPITTAYTYWFDVFDLAPDGLGWTKVKADAVEVTIARTV